jgi:ribonuclease E
MPKEMLINVSEGEECRIALLEDGRLEELYMERTSSTSHVGNIYKGRVTNVEASIQAAFVDFGLGRNGFLHISDLMPTYFGRKGEDIVETVGKKMARRDRPPIQRCLRRGDEIIVQIIKEGIGTKGPTLSSYLSIPGRYLVMMPGVGKMGVSQKIEDDAERRRLRQILDGLKPPDGVGFIIRTAGVGKTKTEIERDLKYLTRLWEQLEKKRLASKGPAELYAEGDLVTRTVRDFFSADVDRIVIDSAEVAERVRDVIKISTPRAKDRVEVYEDAVPLFHKYGIEREIELMYSRHVPLPSGGSLVIDSTEAIVAIDVNSGKFREHNDAEMTAFKTDMEAADEIPRQLKLRDLGGVIICDFIDLRYERNRRELEKRLHDNFKKDRAKTKVLRMSQFGIIEMTRQRMRASLQRSIYFDCPHCKGAGLVKTPESMSLDVMRRIAIAINDLKVARVELAVCPDVAFYLLNKKRRSIARLEDHFDKRVLIRSDMALGLDEMKLELFDSRDGLVMLPELDAALSQPRHKTQLNTRPQALLPNRAGGGAPEGAPGGGRFDGKRRDQGRRPPQQGQQPGRRDDEDESRMEDRADLEEVDADELPADSRGNGAAPADDRGARDNRGQPGGDRGRQDQQRGGGGGQRNDGGRQGGGGGGGGGRDRGPRPDQPAGAGRATNAAARALATNAAARARATTGAAPTAAAISAAAAAMSGAAATDRHVSPRATAAGRRTTTSAGTAARPTPGTTSTAWKRTPRAAVTSRGTSTRREPAAARAAARASSPGRAAGAGDAGGAVAAAVAATGSSRTRRACPWATRGRMPIRSTPGTRPLARRGATRTRTKTRVTLRAMPPTTAVPRRTTTCGPTTGTPSRTTTSSRSATRRARSPTTTMTTSGPAPATTAGTPAAARTPGSSGPTVPTMTTTTAGATRSAPTSRAAGAIGTPSNPG